MKLKILRWFCLFLIDICPFLREKGLLALHKKCGLLAIKLIHKYKVLVWNQIDLNE
jgi:hypothetical protein